MDYHATSICFVLFFIGWGASTDPYRLGLSQDQIINSNTVCGNTPGLTPKQAMLCAKYPHSVASAIQGLQMAIHECKVQFRDERWNCSVLETKNKIPHSSAFLTRAIGNKETAFAHAIAAAGVVHAVAYACSIGKIEECACPQRELAQHLTASQRKQFQKQLLESMPEVNEAVLRDGCDHDINYGAKFAREFLDVTEGRDFVSETTTHNNRVGRLIVMGNMKEVCRCHGISGSCSIRTCWSETPHFRKVGDAIKEKYRRAVRVNQRATGNQAHLTNQVDDSATPRPSYNTELMQDLIFFDSSPSYCRPDPRIAVPGTKGRYCNLTAGEEAPNSCRNLCCGRGSRTHRVRRVEHCNCRFHWCCYVRCDTCEWEETVSVCN